MSPERNITIPDSQKQQLLQAIITLITVVLGIALTLTTQVISDAILSDPVSTQTAEAAHFSGVDVAEGYSVDGGVALDATAAITISGVLTDVVILYHQN